MSFNEQSSAKSFAPNGSAVEILRHRGSGPQNLELRTLEDVSVLVSLLRQRDGVQTSIGSDAGTGVTKADPMGTYARDGTTATFSGSGLGVPVAPGSLVIEETSGAPAVKDLLRDGVLHIDGQARKRAASGSFAALASESMVIRIDGGVDQTITFGTESTIALAVALINSQLQLGTAVAQGAQNVDILSDTSGLGSSVEVVSVDAGITTKLGISAGVSTTIAGSVDYSTGGVELSYPGGYAPSTGSEGEAAVLGTVVGPYDFAPGDTLVVDPDAGGDGTATFDAGPAVATGASGSFAAMSNETMDVQIDGGPVVTVTFGTEASIALAVALINEQIQGGFADEVDANNARITSDGAGTGQVVILSDVDAAITTKLGLANGTSNGTGDVADINVVTVAEIKTVVEADIAGITVTDVEGKVKLTAVVSVNVNATSTTETILGLSTTIATVTSGGSASLKADYVGTEAILGNASKLFRISNMREDDQLIVLVTGLAAPGTPIQADIIQSRI